MQPSRPLRPLITLTTDFGLSDHYVGTTKGVLLSRCPEAQIVDISHGVTAFSIWEGAYTIGQAAPFFPPGTIHVLVVDPGVGTERKPIVAEASGQRFIAPDNGVLSLVLGTDPVVWAIEDESVFLPSVSATFHGRDVFAPAAAALAAEIKSAPEMGRRVPDPVLLSPLEPVPKGDSRFEARVWSVDSFGNIITNLTPSAFPKVTLETAGGVVKRSGRTFGEAAPGEPFLYVGSSGFWEIGINQQSAAQRLQVRPGDTVLAHRF